MKEEIGKTIRLVGKTRLGKNRVKEHGELWEILAFRDNVPCLGNVRGAIVFSIKDGYTRWISIYDDADFKVVG